MNLMCVDGMKGKKRSIKQKIYFGGSSAGKFTVNV